MLCVWNRRRSSATEGRCSASSPTSPWQQPGGRQVPVSPLRWPSRSPLLPILEYPVSFDAVLLSDSPPLAAPALGGGEAAPTSVPARCLAVAIATALSTSTLRRWSRAAAAVHADDGHRGGHRLTSPSTALDRGDPRLSSRRERRRRLSRAGKAPADDVTELENGPGRAVDGRWEATTDDDVSVHTQHRQLNLYTAICCNVDRGVWWA